MNSWKQYMKQGGSGILGLCLFAQTAMGFAAPLTVDQAVTMGLANHLDIKKAISSQQQAKYALESTKGSQGISLDAANTFYLKQIHRQASSSTSSIKLSLPLYTGGKNEGNIGIAKAELTMADLNLLKTRQDVKLNIMAAYYNVIEAGQTQSVCQETVDNYTQHLNDVISAHLVWEFSASSLGKNHFANLIAKWFFIQYYTIF